MLLLLFLCSNFTARRLVVARMAVLDERLYLMDANLF
jgi:hypothetical protein